MGEFLNIFVIKGSTIYFCKKNIMHVSSKHLIAYAFGVYKSGYVEDPNGHVTKTLVEELLFKHDIKPPYTNANQWNFKKCKLPINIRYLVIISIIY